MRSDDRIGETIAAGKRNAEAMRLMRNWCAHARPKRMGGVGMVEEMTDLPIGHFSMECDHAPTGGMAAWNFGESALDFYDRNCVACTVRQPVALPNLSKLVAERDEARRSAEAHNRVERMEAQRALDQRRQARLALRGGLDAVNQGLINDLDSFDQGSEEVDRQRLVEAARMAPERLDARLVDLIFEQSGETNALALLALDVGGAIGPNEARVLVLAQRLFRQGLANESASPILIANLSKMAESDITDLVPAAAELASPDRSSFIHRYEERADSRLLLSMWARNSEAVRIGIDKLLERRTVPTSQLAGRTIRVIIDHDPASAKKFTRTAASRYVRAKQVLNDLDEYENLGDMAGALDLILDLETDELDGVLQGLSLGASIEARRSIANVYALAWRGHSRASDEKAYSTARLRLGLERLASLPSEVFDQEVLRTVAEAFRYPPDEAWPLIADQADRLVGAALLIDEKLTAFMSRQGEPASSLQYLERQNLHAAALNVVENFLKAAAKASTSTAARQRFIEAVKAIPEAQTRLRGVATRVAIQFASDVDGVSAVLPMLYTAIVGASVVGRAEAASALSEIPWRGRQNLPLLVYEAFSVLLSDPYVMVHKYAVRSLSRISLPDTLRTRAGFALFNLVGYYADIENEDDFLVDCIDQLARFAGYLPEPEKVREFCCNATLKAEPLYVRSDARSLRQALSSCDDFALVVAHVLPEYAGNLNGRSDEAELIGAITRESVCKHRARLVEVAKVLAEGEMWISTLVADALYRAGAEAEAIELLTHMKEAYAKTVKDEGRALFVGFPLLSYAMESALAAGDVRRWMELAAEWESRASRQKALLEDRRARDSRSRLSFPH